MKNMFNLMKQAKAIQEKMSDFQKDLDEVTVEGQAGGGMVAITLDGQNVMRAVKIDTALVKASETEILEDLIIAAHNDARDKIKAKLNEKTEALRKDFPLPSPYFTQSC